MAIHGQHGRCTMPVAGGAILLVALVAAGCGDVVTGAAFDGARLHLTLPGPLGLGCPPPAKPCLPLRSRGWPSSWPLWTGSCRHIYVHLRRSSSFWVRNWMIRLR